MLGINCSRVQTLWDKVKIKTTQNSTGVVKVALQKWIM